MKKRWIKFCLLLMSFVTVSWHIDSVEAKEINYADFIGTYQVDKDSQLQYLEITEDAVILYSNEYNPFGAVESKDPYHLLLEAIYNLIVNPHLSSLVDPTDQQDSPEVTIECLPYDDESAKKFTFETDYLTRIEAEPDYFISKSTEKFKIKLNQNHASLLLQRNEDGDLEDTESQITFKRIEAPTE